MGTLALARLVHDHQKGGRHAEAKRMLDLLDHRAALQRPPHLPVDPKCKWES